MPKLVDAINAYFIEMVKDVTAKEAMQQRLELTEEERLEEATLPKTRTLSDAFYVALGCRFQDAPILTFMLMIAFIIVVGLTLANLITSIL